MARIVFLWILFSLFQQYSAETLKVTPERSFLNQNLTVKLVWRFESEKINITVGKFSKEFKFFHDGNEMEDAGGLATNIYTDKQYVDYKLEVKKPGTYIGIISQSNVTAIVNTVKSEEPVKFCKAGAKLELHCDDGPQGSEFLWQIDDKSVVEGKEVSVDDGSLTFTNLDFDAGGWYIGCRYFNDSDALKLYQQNKSAILPYQTAVTYTPIIVYKAKKEALSEESTKYQYAVYTASTKMGVIVRICGTQNRTKVCKEDVGNVSMVLDAGNLNLTMFWGDISFSASSDVFEGVDALPLDTEGTDRGVSVTAVVIPVVIGAVLIAGIIVGVVIWRKKVSQMNSNDEDPAKFPLKTRVKKTGETEAEEPKDKS